MTDALVAQNAELASTLNDVAAERDSLRGVVQAKQDEIVRLGAWIDSYKAEQESIIRHWMGEAEKWRLCASTLSRDNEATRRVVQAVEALQNKWRERARQSGLSVDHQYAADLTAALAAAADAPQPEPATTETQR